MAAFRIDGIENPADRTDCVPQSEEIGRAGETESSSKTCGNLKLARVVALVKSDGVGNQRFISRREQPEHVQQSTKRPSGISAPTKTEDEDLVIGLILSHQEGIHVGDVIGKTIPESQPPYLGPPLSDCAQRISGSHRSKP